MTNLVGDKAISPLRHLATSAAACPFAMDPAAKRTFVQQLFSRIAPRYDWFNRLASGGLDRRWRHRALLLGDVAPGQRVLDVCAGTGELAILCSRRQQGLGTVIGIDRNHEMLALARRKQQAQRLAIGWLHGDAESLPFKSESFDRVLIGFSTRNLSHLAAGLQEMLRVLRPGGRLIILETGYPTNPVVRLGYQLFLLTVARAIGFLLTGRTWPFTYLARSVRQFLPPPQMVECLQRLKTEVQYVPLTHGLASLYLATKGPTYAR